MNRVLAPGLGSTSGARADVVVGINIGTGKRPQVIADCCFLYSLATLTSLALRAAIKTIIFLWKFFERVGGGRWCLAQSKISLAEKKLRFVWNFFTKGGGVGAHPI